MKTKHIVLWSFLLLLNLSYAQTDSIKLNDSINNQLLNTYNKKIAELEQQRIDDSIKKASIDEQLKNLSTADNLKKIALQKELDDLNNKEVIRLQEKKKRIDSLKLTAKPFAVKGFFNDTLFLIYNRLGSFSANERANAISTRIHDIADQIITSKDSLSIIKTESSSDIVMGENIIMSVTENDAIWNNSTTDALAQEYKIIIENAIKVYKDETSFSTLAKEIGLAILVIILLIIALKYLNKLFKWSSEKIIEQEGNWITGIKIRNYTLFDAKSQVQLFTSLNTLIKWLVIAFIIYIALPILFGIFPWTKNFAETLFSYILNPLKKMMLGVWNYLPNLFTIIVITIVFKYILRGIKFLKIEIERDQLKLPGFYPDWANPTYQILRVLLYAFMFILIFPYLPGSDSPIFQGVSVFLGFLFTFGSAGSLSNVIAGLVLTYMRLFKLGDRVKIGDVVGDVIEKNLLVTRIRTIKNEIISIPNSTVMSSHTINYSSETNDKGLIMHTTVTIGYDVPWKKMHEALLTAADRTHLLLKDPKPFVLQTSLDDFYVSYQINAYTKEANKQATIYSDLHQHIQDCCNEMGIEILSPHYRAARDGNMITIPANYLDKDYIAPSFNVSVKNENK
ncbi:MAG: mechanosensitive ion channel [Chitinophagaceae bacterium]|nr:mechanosensitive ion channel [Chitinophagaceae bacterium]